MPTLLDVFGRRLACLVLCLAPCNTLCHTLCLTPLLWLWTQPAVAQPNGKPVPVVVTFSDGSQAELVGIAPHPAAASLPWTGSRR